MTVGHCITCFVVGRLTLGRYGAQNCGRRSEHASDTTSSRNCSPISLTPASTTTCSATARTPSPRTSTPRSRRYVTSWVPFLGFDALWIRPAASVLADRAARCSVTEVRRTCWRRTLLATSPRRRQYCSPCRSLASPPLRWRSPDGRSFPARHSRVSTASQSGLWKWNRSNPSFCFVFFFLHFFFFCEFFYGDNSSHIGGGHEAFGGWPLCARSKSHSVARNALQLVSYAKQEPLLCHGEFPHTRIRTNVTHKQVRSTWVLACGGKMNYSNSIDTWNGSVL